MAMKQDYQSLVQSLREDGVSLCGQLSYVLQLQDVEPLVILLLELYGSSNLYSLSICEGLVQQEFEQKKAANTLGSLLREDGFATRFISKVCQQYGIGFLQELCGDQLQNLSLDIDKDLDCLWKSLTDLRTIPAGLKALFKIIYEQARLVLDEQAALQLIASFYWLRLVVPVIVDPSRIDVHIQSSSILPKLAKSLQGVFGSGDNCSQWVLEHRGKPFEQFLESLRSIIGEKVVSLPTDCPPLAYGSIKIETLQGIKQLLGKYLKSIQLRIVDLRVRDMVSADCLGELASSLDQSTVATEQQQQPSSPIRADHVTQLPKRRNSLAAFRKDRPNSSDSGKPRRFTKGHSRGASSTLDSISSSPTRPRGFSAKSPRNASSSALDSLLSPPASPLVGRSRDTSPTRGRVKGSKKKHKKGREAFTKHLESVVIPQLEAEAPAFGNICLMRVTRMLANGEYGVDRDPETLTFTRTAALTWMQEMLGVAPSAAVYLFTGMESLELIESGLSFLFPRLLMISQVMDYFLNSHPEYQEECLQLRKQEQSHLWLAKVATLLFNSEWGIGDSSNMGKAETWLLLALDVPSSKALSLVQALYTGNLIVPAAIPVIDLPGCDSKTVIKLFQALDLANCEKPVPSREMVIQVLSGDEEVLERDGMGIQDPAGLISLNRLRAEHPLARVCWRKFLHLGPYMINCLWRKLYASELIGVTVMYQGEPTALSETLAWYVTEKGQKMRLDYFSQAPCEFRPNREAISLAVGACSQCGKQVSADACVEANSFRFHPLCLVAWKHAKHMDNEALRSAEEDGDESSLIDSIIESGNYPGTYRSMGLSTDSADSPQAAPNDSSEKSKKHRMRNLMIRSDSLDKMELV